MIGHLSEAAETHVASIDGRSSVFRTWGRGPSLLLVHGASGSWTHWVRNIDHLAATHRVIAPDLPGFGDSDELAGEPSAHQLADATATATTELFGDGPFDLVGFSFGGIIAGLVAERLGASIDRLVLVSAGGLGMTAQVAEVDDTSARGQLVRFMFADDATADDTALQIHLDNIARSRFKSGSIPSSTLLLDALPTAGNRVHAIYGDRDAFCGGRVDEPFGRLRIVRPDISTHTIAGAGHWIPYEKPDQLNALITQILTS